MSDFISVVIAGVAQGVPVFIVASGLTLIYGVLHVLNFAHGAFFLIGAFIVTSTLQSDTIGSFLLSLLIAGVGVMAVGVVSEVAVFRRLYKAGSTVSFLGAFALFLALTGISILIWGTNPKTVAYPKGLNGSFDVLGARISQYDAAMVIVGVVIAVGLWLLLTKTSLGARVRAVSQDRTMAMALGIRVRRVSTMVFAIGAFLAGVAGALITPVSSIDEGLALSSDYMIPAFIVIIVGGLGSVPGALIAALGLGIIESILFRVAPGLSGFSYYLVVAVFLMFRPQGLFGSPSHSFKMAR
ncbi:branched-subunit amino acid ABC-type transport system permease component [Microbacterium ginsengiterrae]|uniref:Branched-subunit amino acid ABC-type transport system permease component n=1 Tax=Microbacterium ginsengiterrae TaxID=546115 RepID=A0A7W9FCL0_9MICO|nr:MULTISPECIES: branched-chain amino acid ABC transporter permease [Microbacterium]MBB5742349.1 branched-subunit amino acid ABC-type transport system permease component [Microbacterium ginsengiterrae]